MASMNDRATAKSAFFTTLPPELRTAILTSAFGDRTVHIEKCHLAWEPQPPQPQKTRSRVALSRARQWLGGVFTDKLKEKPPERKKRWRGIVCCRPPNHPPSLDICRSLWSNRFRETHDITVGAIGWLLSCREAYHEGIKVLYGSNTFHIRFSSWRVFGGLMPQTPTTILTNTTSVEIIMDLPTIGYHDFLALPETDKCEIDMLNRTLSRIPQLMPSLRKFYLGFFTSTCLIDGCDRGNRLYYECMKPIAAPVEAMAHELGQTGRSCEVELAVPVTPFEEYLVRAEAQRHRIAGPAWKPEYPSRLSYYPRLRIFQPAQSPGPEIESGTDEEGPEVGYWISMTTRDGLPRSVSMKHTEPSPNPVQPDFYIPVPMDVWKAWGLRSEEGLLSQDTT